MTAKIIEPPTPCSARQAISPGSVCATPHSSEPAVNTAKPIRNTRVMPHRSPSLPNSSRKLTSQSR